MGKYFYIHIYDLEIKENKDNDNVKKNQERLVKDVYS